MKFFVIAALAALTVVSAGCCRTNRCAAPAPACAPMAPPPMMPPPTLEK
jgi:hypothetical protein